MTDNSEGAGPKEHCPARAQLWSWFIVGFLLVFVGMSIAITMHAMHPSGRAVVECRLWQYYILELRRALRASSGALGPATGSSMAALVTLAEHLLLSAAGGGLSLGLAWGIRKVRGR